MIKERLPREAKDIDESREASIKDIEERTALPEEKTEEEIYSVPGVEPAEGLKKLKEYLKKKRMKEKGH